MKKITKKRLKNALVFIRRHFFTLLLLGIVFVGSTQAPVKWENVMMLLIGAIFIDWVKMFIKPDNSFRPKDTDSALHVRQWSNPSVIGSSSNSLSNLGR